MAHSLIFHHAAARFRADPSDEPPKLGGTPEGGSSRSSALRDSIRSVKRRTSAWYANAGNARSVAPTASTSSKRAQGVAPKRGVASFTTAATTAIPTQTTPARTSYVATGRIVGPLEPRSQRTRDRLVKSAAGRPQRLQGRFSQRQVPCRPLHFLQIATCLPHSTPSSRLLRTVRLRHLARLAKPVGMVLFLRSHACDGTPYAGLPTRQPLSTPFLARDPPTLCQTLELALATGDSVSASYSRPRRNSNAFRCSFVRTRRAFSFASCIFATMIGWLVPSIPSREPSGVS